MEISLARLINTLVKKPEIVAHVDGDIELILAMGGVASTDENKTALSAVLKMIGKQPSNIVRTDSVIGWDGGVGFTALPACR